MRTMEFRNLVIFFLYECTILRTLTLMVAIVTCMSYLILLTRPFLVDYSFEGLCVILRETIKKKEKNAYISFRLLLLLFLLRLCVRKLVTHLFVHSCNWQSIQCKLIKNEIKTVFALALLNCGSRLNSLEFSINSYGFNFVKSYCFQGVIFIA